MNIYIYILCIYMDYFIYLGRSEVAEDALDDVLEPGLLDSLLGNLVRAR